MKLVFDKQELKRGLWFWFSILIYAVLTTALALFTVCRDHDEAPREPASAVETATDVKVSLKEAPAVALSVEQEEEGTRTMSGSDVSAAPLYFNVPLDKDLQDYIFLLCDEYGIDPAVIIAMIEKESTYRVDCVGDNGNSYGLMQIQPRWHSERMRDLGCSDLLDPYQNVSVGIDILGELLSQGKGLEWALIAYNGGASYANRLAAEGRVSDYARFVLNRMNEIERG